MVNQFVRTRLTVVILALAIGLGATGLQVATSPTAHASGWVCNEGYNNFDSHPYAGEGSYTIHMSRWLAGWATLTVNLAGYNKGGSYSSIYIAGWYNWTVTITAENGFYVIQTLGRSINAGWTGGWQQWGACVSW